MGITQVRFPSEFTPMFGKQHAEHIDPDLPITPMLDTTFQLLSFFVFTFHPQAREAQIAFPFPEDRWAADFIPDPSSPDDRSTVVLVVQVRATEDGRIQSMTLRIEDRSVRADDRPPRTEIDPNPEAYRRVLTEKCREYAAQNPPRKLKLQLECSGNLSWGRAVQLIDLAKQVGFTDVVPMALPKDPD